MKLIDLLVKIANNELPNGTEIRATKESKWVWFKFFRHQELFNAEQLSKIMAMGIGLNDEVEVIEKKEIEKITKKINKVLRRELVYKLNEIIEEVNELKKGK